MIRFDADFDEKCVLTNFRLWTSYAWKWKWLRSTKHNDHSHQRRKKDPFHPSSVPHARFLYIQGAVYMLQIFHAAMTRFVTISVQFSMQIPCIRSSIPILSAARCRYYGLHLWFLFWRSKLSHSSQDLSMTYNANDSISTPNVIDSVVVSSFSSVEENCVANWFILVGMQRQRQPQLQHTHTHSTEKNQF